MKPHERGAGPQKETSVVTSWDDLAERRRPLLLGLFERWNSQNVDVLVLRGPGPDEMTWASPHNTVELLVRPRDAASALKALGDTDWRYELGSIGVLRRLRSAGYIYDMGPALYLHWGVPFAPLPSRLLSGLERSLWVHPRRTGEGWPVPADEPLLLWLAVQAARPGRLHRNYDWEQFCKTVPPPDSRDTLRTLARRLKFSKLLDQALERADARKERPAGPVLDGPFGRIAYRLGEQIRKRGPGRIRALAKTPEPGDVPCRVNFGGVEVDSAPPAFCPMHTTESFLPPAEEKIATLPSPVIIDAGTGVGAVGLAIAAAHPSAEVHGTDIGRSALRWARRNARRLGIRRAHFYLGSLTEPLPTDLKNRVDVIFANLPYYPEKRYVPVGAIARDAIQGTDEDGLGLYRELADQALEFLKPGGRLIMQMFGWQWEYFSDELASMGLQPSGHENREPFVVAWADRRIGQ